MLKGDLTVTGDDFNEYTPALKVITMAWEQQECSNYVFVSECIANHFCLTVKLMLFAPVVL